MECELCKNSYYPKELSGHRWIPNEPTEHYNLRRSVKHVQFTDSFYTTESGKKISVLEIPRYSTEDNTDLPLTFLIIKDEELYNLCFPYVGEIDKSKQKDLMKIISDNIDKCLNYTLRQLSLTSVDNKPLPDPK